HVQSGPVRDEQLSERLREVCRGARDIPSKGGEMMPAMTPARDLETRALTLADQAKALKIVDQQSYQTAVERLLAVADLRREIVAHHEPIKRAAHIAWQQIIAAEKRLLDPVTDAERIYKTGISNYETQQRRLEAEARAIAEAAARRAAAEAREHEIE